MRLTNKVFHDLAIWMVAFGLIIGVVFPFFVMALGVAKEVALTPQFFAACLGAGAVVGIANYSLAKGVVGTRLRVLATSMRHVEGNLKTVSVSGDMNGCTPEECSIPIDSEDEIGESGLAFNRLVDALAHSMETQHAVRAFSELLTSNLELESLARKTMEQFMVHTGASGGAILYEADGELRIAASLGLKDADSLLRNDLVNEAVRTGRSQTVKLPDGITVEGVLADFRPSEVHVIPAKYKDVPLGVVVLGKSSRFDADQLTRMDLFSRNLGLALNNAIAHDRLQRLAALDSLTGVYNRRFGLGRLHEEFGRAVRASSPLGVLMLDIDHFKKVNDTYGHLVGDRILKSVAGVVKNVLREGDLLVRFGGEEFLVVLPAASGDDLKLIGERIRRSVEDSSVAEGRTTVKVTASLGGAAYPSQNVDKEDVLVQLADDALYRAKESGRNRVDIAK